MPIDPSIYGMLDTRGLQSGIQGIASGYLAGQEQRARLSNLARQNELGDIQLASARRAEAAIPEQERQRNMQELSSALAIGIQQKNGISNQELMDRTYEEAMRRGLKDEDVAQLFQPWASVRDQTDGESVANVYAQRANPQEAIKQRLEAQFGKKDEGSPVTIMQQGKPVTIMSKSGRFVGEAVPKQDTTLVQVQLPTGETVYQPRAAAAGMAVPQKVGKESQLSAQAQKELFEADETIQASSNVIGLLDQAKALNKTAYSGYGAKQRAIARSNLPGASEEADATINLDNIMTSQALESLKAVFGGMPTEGERKILMDIQASVDKTPLQREAIMNRAKTAVENRIKFSTEKANKLRSGEYFKPTQSSTKQPAASGAKFLGFE